MSVRHHDKFMMGSILGVKITYVEADWCVMHL